MTKSQNNTKHEAQNIDTLLLNNETVSLLAQTLISANNYIWCETYTH
jgi:hypothetical protein